MSPEAILAAAEAVERAYLLERGQDRRVAWLALGELANKHRPQHPAPAPDTEPGTTSAEAPSWRL